MTITSFACQIDYCSAVTLMLTEMIDWPPRELGGPASGLIPSQQFSDTSVRKRIIGMECVRETQTTPEPHLLLPLCPLLMLQRSSGVHKGQGDPWEKGDQFYSSKDLNHFSYAKIEEGEKTFWLKRQTHNGTNVWDTKRQRVCRPARSTLMLNSDVGWIWT